MDQKINNYEAELNTPGIPIIASKYPQFIIVDCGSMCRSRHWQTNTEGRQINIFKQQWGQNFFLKLLFTLRTTEIISIICSWILTFVVEKENIWKKQSHSGFETTI